MFFIQLNLQLNIPILFVLFCLTLIALTEVSRYVLKRDYVVMVKVEGKWFIVVEEEWFGDQCKVWLQEVEE